MNSPQCTHFALVSSSGYNLGHDFFELGEQDTGLSPPLSRPSSYTYQAQWFVDLD